MAEAYRLGRPYTLLMTDYIMPEVDGLCLVTSIRQNTVFDKLRIIVLSSMTDKEVEQTFMSQDVSDYLVKPVLEDHLRDSVYTILKPVISHAA